MTIRGGGNPNSAMAAMPLGEWTRRLGALPAEAYDCFMVETPCGFNRIQAWFARLLAANGRLPSDHRGRPPDHGQPAVVLACTVLCGGRDENRVPTATAPRIHLGSRRRGCVAARGAGAATGDAGDRIPQRLIA